ncbi:MAG: class I SAM-dependent methyltransferase [Pseudomonadota bacterium]|nr:class I SAM-dependent methyltransferase [Pseudomonadota bacterium]
MPADSGARNWFDRGGQAYARFRPQYPTELARFLAQSSPSRELALDVGCGSGQFSTLLADHFDEVIGCDPSAEQIANARARHGVRYLCSPAEKLPLPDRRASLVTAAQAAHWFDLSAFYAETRRVAREGALIALVSYGVLRPGAELQSRFDHFYQEEIGPYWPAERKLVDSGYRDMSFPFTEIEVPVFEIRMSWTLDDFLGYVSTWSAAQRLREAGDDDVLVAFARDISTLWSAPSTARPMTWPVNMRVGRLD